MGDVKGQQITMANQMKQYYESRGIYTDSQARMKIARWVTSPNGAYAIVKFTNDNELQRARKGRIGDHLSDMPEEKELLDSLVEFDGDMLLTQRNGVINTYYGQGTLANSVCEIQPVPFLDLEGTQIIITNEIKQFYERLGIRTSAEDRMDIARWLTSCIRAYAIVKLKNSHLRCIREGKIWSTSHDLPDVNILVGLLVRSEGEILLIQRDGVVRTYDSSNNYNPKQIYPLLSQHESLESVNDYAVSTYGQGTSANPQIAIPQPFPYPELVDYHKREWDIAQGRNPTHYDS